MLVIQLGWRVWVFAVFGCFVHQCAASWAPTNVAITAPPLAFVNETKGLDVIIVYFGYIHPTCKHWLELMSQQLDEFNCNGLAKRAKRIYISLSMDHTSEKNTTSANRVNLALSTLQKIHPKALFDLTLENRYEYPGIRAVWDIARVLSPTDAQKTIIIYMQSKGMSHAASELYGVRMPLERMLFHATFDPWDHVLHMFHKHPQLNKVGAAPSEPGFVWFNIFYARASYIQTLINPTIAKNRYYYEAWLSFLNPNPIWPRIRHIEFAEKNVPRPGKPSGCADCWSTTQGRNNETLGVVFTPKTLPGVYLSNVKWHKCREPTVLAVTTNKPK